MVKAGALYYAIFIIFVITLITGFIFYIHLFQNQYITSYVQHEKIESNIESALELYCSNPGIVSQNANTSIDLFDSEEEINKVNLKRYYWGVYDLVEISCSWKSFEQSNIYLTGKHLKKAEPFSLYLTDLNNSLSVCGDTRLVGNCYLPKLLVKRAYIEGKNYTGDKLVYGENKHSTSEILKHNQATYIHALEIIGEKWSTNDTLMDFEKYYFKDTLTNSFYNKTQIYTSHEAIELQNQRLEGNVMVHSKKEIVVERTTELKDIILTSKKVIIEKGFEGNCQIFASDTVIIEEDVSLLYPSFIVIINEETDKEILLEMHKKSVLAGGAFVFRKDNTLEKIHCDIEDDAIVYGSLYSNGLVQFKGTVYGSLICSKFILKTASSVYENHLLDAVIDYSKLPRHFAGAMFYDKPILHLDIKCLESRVK